MSVSLLCLFLAFGSGINPKTMRAEINEIVNHPRFSDSFWGLVVYAPARGKVLLKRNADKSFRPASNLKILTTMLAFEYLGIHHRFDTEIGYRGTLRDGVLDGDLIIIGSGDPSISGNYDDSRHTRDILAAIIADLKMAGLRRVNGNLTAVVDAFDDHAIQKSWEWDDMGNYYAVPVTPLTLHNGWIDLQLRADEAGTLHLNAWPDTTPGLQLNVWVTSLPGEETVSWQRPWGTNHFNITGNLPPCETVALLPAAWDTTAQFLSVFDHALKNAGIAVSGRQLVADTPIQDMHTLAIHQSEPLGELARVLMKDSQNHYADVFLKATARQVMGEGSFDAGKELASIYLKEQSGTDTQNVRDGSGLSAQNYITPNQLKALLLRGLQVEWRDTWLRTLPVFGQDGTLSKRGDETTKKAVWAKTGYIYRSRNLAGYVETKAGEPLIFVALANNYSCATREVNQAQDDIAAVLRRLKPNRAYRKAKSQHHLLSKSAPP